MVGFLDTRDMAANFEACRLYTRTHAKTFYFASHVLPEEKRMAAYAVYAFCRYADNVIDTATMPEAHTHALSRIAALHDQLRYMYSYSPLMDPRLAALRETVFRYQIPREYFTDLLRGVEMDLTCRRYETFDTLKVYCYCVASVVGLIMTRIFGVSDERAMRHASDLGTAMQLTNILRDIGEDARMGRVYLPGEELERFGYSEAELAAGRINENFVSLMQYQITRARGYYAGATRGLPMLTDDGSRFCVRLMSRTYARILDVIETNQYDVFTRRATVPASTKVAILIGAAVGRKERPAVPAAGSGFTAGDGVVAFPDSTSVPAASAQS